MRLTRFGRGDMKYTTEQKSKIENEIANIIVDNKIVLCDESEDWDTVDNAIWLIEYGDSRYKEDYNQMIELRDALKPYASDEIIQFVEWVMNTEWY